MQSPRQRNFLISILLICLFLFTTEDSNAQTYTSKSQFNSSPFAVVELFTSEGCSSCPNADQLLIRINNVAVEHKIPIYPLSFHVDYWNYLGWTDPYSENKHTLRQKIYAAKNKTDRLYTPQMIINGTGSIESLNQLLTEKSIKDALVKPAKAVIHLNAVRIEQNLRIRFSVRGQIEEKLINIAVVENNARQFVKRGENAERTLDHVNVVRLFKTFWLDENKNVVDFTLPDELDLVESQIIVYVQDPTDMSIIGANRLLMPNPT